MLHVVRHEGDDAGSRLHDVHGQVLVCLIAGLVRLHIRITRLRVTSAATLSTMVT